MTMGSGCLAGGGGGGAVEVDGWGGSGRFVRARADEESGRLSDHEMRTHMCGERGRWGLVKKGCRQTERQEDREQIKSR